MGEIPELSSHNFYQPFTANMAGFIVPLITGLLSACSSGLIIYIISKSQQKLSTTYHRIMAFMSFFDIISSIFIALGTIMVPSDTIYKFAGPMLGNKVTCQIQGWLIIFGVAGSTSLNACLAWYFPLNIAFKLNSSTISNRIEPVMYAYSVFLSFFLPSIYLSKDLLNPHVFDSFCTIVPYPESCDEEKWYDWKNCTWSEGDLNKNFTYVNLAAALITVQFSLIVLGMTVILFTVFKNRKEIIEATDDNECESDQHEPPLNDTEESSKCEIEYTNRNDHIEHLKYNRVVIFQALMYIVAFFSTWIFNMLSWSLNISGITLDVVNCILFPLQGFWNLLIFLHDKAYLIRQRDRRSGSANISLWKAFKMILASPSDMPTFVVSNISDVIIEPHDHDTPNLTPESPSDSYESDIPLSQIGSEYDVISELRGDGNFSIQNTSSVDVNSGALSEVGKVSSSEHHRVRMTNALKSDMQIRMLKKDCS